MSGTAPEVWIMTSDGHNLIRANAIMAVHHQDDGAVMARLADAAQAMIPLATGSAEQPIPADFHRDMVCAVAELADASGAQLVRAHHDGRSWHWVIEPL